MFMNFGDNRVHPFEIAILESNRRANEVIEYLKECIDAGIDPNDVEVNYTHILEEDRAMIKAAIEDYIVKKRLLF